MTVFSVLDLIPLNATQTPKEALADSHALVQRADALGYGRYWVAEHHNSGAIASTAPAVALAYLGTGTERIRLGSGGVMLPNHSPLVIAEQFALLEAMYPGRIDVGLGRAPGTDPITARALRRDMSRETVDRYPSDVLELAGYLGDVHEQVDPELFKKLRAAAEVPNTPEIWLLGSSLYSAELAGVLGMAYSYANHFAMNGNPVQALDHYRENFRPSAALAEPKAMVSASVLVADSIEEGRRLDLPTRVFKYQLFAGEIGPTLTPEDAKTFSERVVNGDLWKRAAGSQHVGPADLVADGLKRLVQVTGADELIMQPNGYDFATREHSLVELAREFGLGSATE
ncbi:LLM class flavin-dependent oxidoreductase [Gulosibacter sediminis]|uniref:LLM class flavin-dependent oxidoreductase n=1 Tax=Gulosibacter sediminis TaxID=1729695 RepID=UPI0024AD9626|nr:LLM class flavin-dependent oxidoreductase [Gulosibacter sediminis]